MDLFTARGLLEVPVGASAATLREQYRIKARTVHPDALVGASEQALASATEAMAELNCAYKTLLSGISDFVPTSPPPVKDNFWENVSEVVPAPTFGAYASFARPARPQWGRRAVFVASLAVLAVGALLTANQYSPTSVTASPPTEGITPLSAFTAAPPNGVSQKYQPPNVAPIQPAPVQQNEPVQAPVQQNEPVQTAPAPVQQNEPVQPAPTSEAAPAPTADQPAAQNQYTYVPPTKAYADAQARYAAEQGARARRQAEWEARQAAQARRNAQLNKMSPPTQPQTYNQPPTGVPGTQR